MSKEIQPSPWRNVLISVVVSSLVLYIESDALETYLMLPAPLWVIGGTVIAAAWTFVKYGYYEVSNNGSHDCSACGIFGHKLPWILMVGCGLMSLIELSKGWRMFCAYAIVIALFSLAGSMLMMLNSLKKSAP